MNAMELLQNKELSGETCELIMQWLMMIIPDFDGQKNPDYNPNRARSLHLENRKLFDEIIALDDDMYAACSDTRLVLQSERMAS